MKKFLILVLVLIFGWCLNCEAKYQRGYFRKDGTYVGSHLKSNANSSKLDNYSSKGNYNPQSGKKGYKDPYKFKSYKRKK